MNERGVIYPIGPYPQIREFAAMVEQLEPESLWNGVSFLASAGGSPVEFQFRRHSDGVALIFSEADWKKLKTLFTAAMAEPKMQPVFAELALVYGEL
jgi:hypothetical protein